MPLDRNRWNTLWAATVPEPAKFDPFTELAESYAQRHRHYHTAAHINACLALFDEVRSFVCDPGALELAIWFHDVVYDPRAGDNEEQSAQCAVQALERAGGDAAFAKRVAEMILATKAHQPRDGDDGPWMLDIDLAVLAAPSEVLAAFEAGIRMEYAWVEPRVYREKRAHVLAGFLARPRIYLTAFFFERFETAARRNLQQLLGQLQCGIG